MRSLLQKTLLFNIVYTQLFLWCSYFLILPRYKTSIFWGNIPSKDWNYYLYWAAVAYFFNLVLLGYFSFTTTINDSIIYKIIICLLVYYGLQMFFLPSLLQKNRIWTKLLLGICVIPMIVLMLLGLNVSLNIKSVWMKLLITISSILPCWHVFYNDFYLYGLNV